MYVHVLFLLCFTYVVTCAELVNINPDKLTNITSNDRTGPIGTWSAFFRIVIATTEYGVTSNNDAEIQLAYHESNNDFGYVVIANSPHMPASDIFTCTAHEPSKSVGSTKIHVTDTFKDGASCLLHFNIYNIDSDVSIRYQYSECGKKQPKGGKCSAPQKQTVVTTEVKKAEVSIVKSSNTNLCQPEAGLSPGEAKTVARQKCGFAVTRVQRLSAHNCEAKLYMCDGECDRKTKFPNKEKGYCIIR